MNLAMKTAAAVCLLAAILVVGGASATPVPRKKCIACGWEFGTVSPAQLLANADKFADTAIDGVGIYLSATNSAGRKIDTHGFTSDQEWDFEAFADQLPALKQIARTDHLRESFIKCFNAPKKRIPWTDDAEWARIARNMGVAGRLLRETGLKGVCCDPEDYHGQGQYRRAGDDPPYDELAKTVRQRGREVFGALFREQPEAKILFYWFLTFDISYFSAPNPREAAREAGDLWPAFADGIMDVLPPEAVIIDGDEHAYGYTCDGSNFHLSATRQRQFAPLLLSPENRAKHAAQVQVGFGFYLDYYASRKPEGSTFFKPVEGSMTERFRRNYLDGGRIADEYVWLWGEWLRTVDWEGAPIQKHITERKWSEALPGIYEAMVDLNRPGFGFPQRRAALEAEGEMRDLNPNPGFTPESGAAPDAIPAPYGIYNGNEKTEIRLAKEGDGDDASLSMTAQKGSSRAVTCFVKDLLPGDVLLVTCRAKGNVRIVPGWQGRRGTGEYGWLWGLGNMPPLKFSDPDESGWRTAEAYLVVPGCADGLGFDIKPGETGREVLVDNLHVWKLW
jgi:hypothetical protein